MKPKTLDPPMIQKRCTASSARDDPQTLKSLHIPPTSYGIFRVVEGEGGEVKGVTLEGRIIPVKGEIRAKKALEVLHHGIIKVMGQAGFKDDMVDNLISLKNPGRSIGGGGGAEGVGGGLGGGNGSFNGFLSSGSRRE